MEEEVVCDKADGVSEKPVEVKTGRNAVDSTFERTVHRQAAMP